MTSSIRFSVFGAGSWGTALAVHLARAGARVTLWGRDASLMGRLAENRENADYLPGIELPAAVQVATELGAAAARADVALLVCPSQGFAELLRALHPHLRPGADLVWACKGFERDSGRLLHQVADEVIGLEAPKAVLTGPSFAQEVARGLPTALTVASEQLDCAERIAGALHQGTFRAYTTRDIIGAEFGGAAKNVYAIATGIADGMVLGHNARAALITRGLHEMMRLGAAIGARSETLMGLSGMGDLVLTCTGDLSRNRRFGLALGRDAASDLDPRQIVEGVGATAALCRLADQHAIDTPIAHQVQRILEHGVSPQEGVRALLAREQKHERE